MIELSSAEARRIALAAQGFADARPTGRVDRRHLRKVFAHVGVIQIDSVNVLVRSQELILFARLGAHPRSLLPDALDAGALFEYWAHVAAIVPSEHHRLWRWRMEQGTGWKAVDRLGLERPEFVAAVLDRIRRDGPITAADLDQRIGPKGPWWDWDDGKIALEHLFVRGLVTARRRRRDFARLYDLPERVLPTAVLDAPTPTEAEARKELIELAARSLGVATFNDLTDYHRQVNAACTPLARELVEEGRLLPARVEGWARPAYLHADAARPRRVNARALLSPFDSLVWYRERTERLFGFHYRIEIYVPAPKRVYGYYVLPFLLGDELVGRVDLKADRAAGVLRVQGAYAEPGVPAGDVAEELADELHAMAGWLGLDVVASTERGELAAALVDQGMARLEPSETPAPKRPSVRSPRGE